MGIYDRDYYREGPSYLDALIPSGLVCKWLIGINIVVFIAQIITRGSTTLAINGMHTPGWLTTTFWLKPDDVLSGQVWQLLSYAFLHDPDNFWHIALNMLFLWWFGSDLELMYGPREFLTFYLVSALAGGVAYQAWALARHENIPCLGASGAVTALLVLCACHFPTRLIYVMMLVPVPLWLFAIFNVALDGYRLISGQSYGVAVSVHVAGAAFAFAYYKLHWRLYEWLTSWSFTLPRRRSRPRLRLFRPEDADLPQEPVPVHAASAGEAGPVDEHLEAKLDAVLEKLARSGKESLTDGERQILMRASEIYKRRRT
jgi:membrane associated rhomboid family serine protease